MGRRDVLHLAASFRRLGSNPACRPQCKRDIGGPPTSAAFPHIKTPARSPIHISYRSGSASPPAAAHRLAARPLPPPARLAERQPRARLCVAALRQSAGRPPSTNTTYKGRPKSLRQNRRWPECPAPVKKNPTPRQRREVTDVNSDGVLPAAAAHATSYPDSTLPGNTSASAPPPPPAAAGARSTGGGDASGEASPRGDHAGDAIPPLLPLRRHIRPPLFRWKVLLSSCRLLNYASIGAPHVELVTVARGCI
jgi:hypothetical protein